MLLHNVSTKAEFAASVLIYKFMLKSKILNAGSRDGKSLAGVGGAHIKIYWLLQICLYFY